MLNKGLLIFILSTLISNTESYQGDASLAPMKIPSCGFCHGTEGISTQANYPNLQGQNERYLFTAMKAYQNSERTAPLAIMMRQQLSRLNDQDIADIAAFYAEME